jgi:hypothetical protein
MRASEQVKPQDRVRLHLLTSKIAEYRKRILHPYKDRSKLNYHKTQQIEVITGLLIAERKSLRIK